VFLDGVRVPDRNRLGPPNGGFKTAMSILNNGRTGLGGGAVGMMKRCIELATAHASERKQFGEPIASFGLIKQKLGQMLIDCYAAESLVSMVAGLIDGEADDYGVEAAISKVFASEALWRVADEALQIAGGNGFMREFPYERFLRDCRINRIFEGTNEVLRLFIALTAMKDVGTGLRELSSSLKGVFDDPIKGFGVLTDYARLRAKVATGFGQGELAGVHERLREPAVTVLRSTRFLAGAADRILRKHGRDIIGKQFASRRLADIMIDLFALVCVLSRVDAAVKANGVPAAMHEIEILEAFAQQAHRRITDNLARIDDNEDELIKSLAGHAVEVGEYGWDSV
jgi:alkylation response protein AidB-like acyl-CoA dehydrogenase